MRPTVQVGGGNRFGPQLRQLRERLGNPSRVLVGVPKSAGSYEDGAPIAVIAAVQEFGSANGVVPERSFLRVPLQANQDVLAEILVRGLPDVLEGASMFALMDQLGARAASISQEAIAAGIPPPNAPSTIARKGSSTPLIDTGFLRQSITWVVEDDEQ